MKKLFLTAAVVLGMATMGLAQGGMFEKGDVPDYGTNNRDGGIGLALPNQHGSDGDFNGDDAPLGGGIAVLLGLGAAYLVSKNRKD